MKAGIMLATVITLSCVVLSSCNTGGQLSSDTNIDLALPAHEYGIYLSTEITTVLNQLSTRMSNGRIIAGGTGGYDSEIKSTEYSIRVIDECLNTVKDINMTGSYTDDMTEAIRLIEEASNELETYKDCLTMKNKESIRDSISKMELIFASLTVVSNQIYK